MRYQIYKNGLALLLLLANSILAMPVIAATVDLATAPLATSTTTSVKPNLLFVLDNSGSMSFTYLPDKADDFRGAYGYHSSQCNAIYYNPNITYLPPLDANKNAYPDATFTAAKDSGFDSSTTTRDLNSQFTANRFEPDAANTAYSGFGSSAGGALGPYGAFYYDYSGTVTNKNYSSSTSPFYIECNNSIGSATSVFSKRRLASNQTTTIVINSSADAPPTATIRINTASSASVGPGAITLNGVAVNTSGTSSTSSTTATVASNIAAKINAYGNGYAASTGGTSTVTITGPVAALGSTPNFVPTAGSVTKTITAFTALTINSVTVNGVQLLSAPAVSSSSTTTTASNIAAKITLNGFSATSSSNVITVTGPTSAVNYAPIVTSATTLTYSTDVFPDTSPEKLTNFANWYSYYRNRMLMMKTSAGRAFSKLDASYRVGLMKINTSNTPVVEVGPFESTKRSDWYSTFYDIDPNGGTPLREALSRAGLYYAGKLSGTDPVQYSCQQNFTILSTDGYWNGNNGMQLDGSTDIGNQDNRAARPMYDGSTLINQWTFTYTRDFYSKVKADCPTSNSTRKLQTQPQIGSCTKTSSTGSCAPANWTNDGAATISGSCNTTSAPSASAGVIQSIVQDTTSAAYDTLADVAMYYYQNDLRDPSLSNCGTIVSPATVGPLCENNVFVSSTDNNTQQHMTTFTLGLGGSGKMNYSSSYLIDTTGDYVAVKLGSVAHPAANPPICSWQADGTTCNWPLPGSDKVENIDDMWHAAVNGRGAYFSATNPTSLAEGLSNALSSVASKKGAAAAAATSTLNPITDNNSAFFASYTTVDWRGNLESRSINTDTGVISANATWCVEDITAGSCATNPVAQTTGDTTIYNCETPNAVTCDGGVLGYSGNSTSGTTYCKVQVATTCQGTMKSLVNATTDIRVIKTANSTGNALIDFDSTYATANPTFFDATALSGLSQWSSLTPAQQTLAVGSNLVNFLRGKPTYEDISTNANKLYRYRQAVLGDALESQPTYVGSPVFSYPYPGYAAFKTAKSARLGTVYLGTNEGMMHAFDATNVVATRGKERWAYVPSMVIPNMWKLADKNYSTLHKNFVNGTPATSEICTLNCTDAATAVWKTILVGGLGGGGRGYYALDITDPNNPSLLWEFTTTAGIGVTKDDDLGFSYGVPIITRLSDANNTWAVIVTSGYNNVSPGDGKGYLYVLNANTGAMISKISTNTGGTSTPSGLAKVAGYNLDPVGNSIGYVYGGDLGGNIWRFDVNDSVTDAAIGKGSVMKFATLFSDAAGSNSQPVTTTPVLGKISGKRVIFVGTGKYLETGDLSTTQLQTEYAIQDDDVSATLVNPRNTLIRQTLSASTDGSATRVATNIPVNFYTGRGWFVDFPESGERVNIDGTLIQGALILPTIVPSNTACSPGGHGWLNFLNYQTGGALDSTGLASYKYDSPLVGGNVIYIDGNPVFIPITADGTIQTPPTLPIPPIQATFKGKRTLWRELIQ
ncbi:MAG TPA: PilC/PilY family type IV pilus protein [Methylotenera sp.]|nr:PilC/PilY family type IV pilus protein [Methylotenera sp.]